MWITSIEILLILTSLLFGLLLIKIIGFSTIQFSNKNDFGKIFLNTGKVKRIDIILSAYNEEKVIVGTIENLLKIDYEDFMIFIIDDGSIDNTLQLLKDNFNKHEKVKIHSKKNEGKAEALNYALLHSYAEIVVFVDADTHVSSNILRVVNLSFEDEKITALAGHLKVRNTVNMLTISQNIEYLATLNLEREFLEKIDSLTTIPGAICAYRKKQLMGIGSFKGEMVTEDCDVTFKFLRLGLKIKNVKNLIGYTEAPESLNMLMRQRIRWDYGLIQNLVKHREYITKDQNFNSIKLWLVFCYSWLYKILYKILLPLTDYAFLVSIFEGFKIEHAFYISFLIFESLFFLLILVRERYSFKAKTLIFLLYRIVYRQFMFCSLIMAVYRFLMGKKNVWKKINRYTT